MGARREQRRFASSNDSRGYSGLQVGKRAFTFRFHTTPEEAGALARTFGCARLVYNKALHHRTHAYTSEGREISYVESSATLAQWKETEDLASLNEVSSVPRLQALRHLQATFANSFAERAKYPTFKTVVIEDLTVRNLVKNHTLARAVSDASWRRTRTMPECTAPWYGRELLAVDRWVPSSKLCSACGALQRSMPLNVREWVCACGVSHDRDVNAAKNILAAGPAER